MTCHLFCAAFCKQTPSLKTKQLREELVGSADARTHAIEIQEKADALAQQVEGQARAKEKAEEEVTETRQHLCVCVCFWRCWCCSLNCCCFEVKPVVSFSKKGSRGRGVGPDEEGRFAGVQLSIFSAVACLYELLAVFEGYSSIVEYDNAFPEPAGPLRSRRLLLFRRHERSLVLQPLRLCGRCHSSLVSLLFIHPVHFLRSRPLSPQKATAQKELERLVAELNRRRTQAMAYDEQVKYSSDGGRSTRFRAWSELLSQTNLTPEKAFL